MSLEESTEKYEYKPESNLFEEGLVTAVLKHLVNEAKEIILARFGENNLRITFREGRSALNAAKYCSLINVMNRTLSVNLKTPNWIEAVECELRLSVNNTIPLAEKEFDDLDYHVNLDESLGPEFDPAAFYHDDDDELPHSGQTSPTMSTDGSETAERPPPVPGRSTLKMLPPSLPPPPKSGALAPSRPSSPSLARQPAKPPPPTAAAVPANNKATDQVRNFFGDSH